MIRKLVHAVAVAEEGSFVNAARRLNLTQPALTRSIQSLEATLGLLLFDRGTAGVHPTVDGSRILEHARALLRQASNLRSEAELLARGETGRISLGLGPMLTPALGPALAATLADGAQFEINVEIEAAHMLSELLLDDRIDFFIADTKQASGIDGLDVIPLQQVSAGFYVRAGHPLALMPAVTPADLDGYLLASPARGNSFAELSPSGLIACEDCHALKQTVLASEAVMVGMNLSVQPELRQGLLARLSGARLPLQSSPVGVVHRSGRTLSASAGRFIENFREILSELESNGSGSGIEGDG